MIKRASTILLTLFLLLTSAQLWGQNYVTGVTVAETSFESNTGTYPCKISDIKCKNPSNESYATSLQYVTSNPSVSGTYTINNGNLIIKQTQTGDQNIVLAGNFSGLVSASGYNNYKITIKLGKSNGDDYEVRCKTYYNGNDNNEVNKGPGSTITIDATCVGGSVSFTMFFNWINNGTLTIESISVVGASEKKIISSESPAVCSGKETVLSGLGVSGSTYQWHVSDDNITYTPIPGATHSTYTVAVTEPKYYKVNDIPGLLVYPVLCCSDNTVGSNISERFQMSTSSKAYESLSGNNRIDAAYKPASSSPIGDGYYAVVHTAVDGGHWSNSPVKAKSLTTDPKDGFLLVNCSPSDHGKAMFMRLFDNLCPNTLYKFSASVANIDMKASDLGIDVKFDVIAKEGPKNGQSLLPEPISVSVACGNSTWIEKNISFVTSGCTKVEVRLYNNVENTSGKGGNDVGLDDIIFGLCTPEIALYSNDAWTAKDREICPDDEPDTYLNVGSAMNLDDILPGQKYYYFEYKDGNTWKAVAGTNPTTSNKIKVELQETTHSTGVLYRAWVAGDATTVVDAAKGKITNTCTAYAQSDAITLTYKCSVPTVESKAPVMNNYNECPTAADKIDLTTLIKSISLVDGTSVDLKNISNYGELKWYKEDGTELTDTNVYFPRQGETNKYKVTFKQKDDASTKYRASAATEFSVSIKGAIDLYIVQDSREIEYCSDTFQELIDYDRTIFTDYIGSSLPSGTEFTWTDANGNVLQQGPEDSYKLPLDTRGNGEITVIAADKNNTVCPSKPVSAVYNIIKSPSFDLTIEIPCKDKLATDGIKLNFTNIVAEDISLIDGFYEINRTTDGTYSNTSFIGYKGEKELEWNDMFDPSDDPTKVKYEVYLYTSSLYTPNPTIGNMVCYYELYLPSKDEYYDITDTNQFSLTSNATNTSKDPKKVEYHACEGAPVTVTSDYELKPGEHYEWYVNDEKDENADPDNKNYTIAALGKTTTFKAVIVADAGTETCGGAAEVKVIMDTKPEVTVENRTVCTNDTVHMKLTGAENSYTYEWTPISNLSNADIKKPVFKTDIAGEYEYSLDVKNGVCTTTVKDITITSYPLPVINSIEVITDENGIKSLDVNIDGNSPYCYSLDGETYGLEGDLPAFLPIGWNILYVKDTYGCKSSDKFKVDPAEIKPEKYFTPNKDGINETWDVLNLNTYSSYIVEIFDRHGKRLFVQRVGSFNTGAPNTVDEAEFTGWKGEYNGELMPSDDYWYLITVEDIRKQYTGHFTLKR